jgi:hypothetical protein
MKKINDISLYRYFSIVTAVIALILALIAGYSIFKIEPDIKRFLYAKENIDDNYKKAYLLLRDPQIFARYENFDAISQPVKMILKDFDKKTYQNEKFSREDSVYLEILLERRMLGSKLTRNTMIFFLLLSVLGWGIFFYERSGNKGESS